ncbi:MauE/DoxX family redox-associated membrane protein [Streptosporangium sp. V21-05]|uniref:MauE/DoxX family redox-associated membrane protein n=1 Tax=Streptosporangium sp. V21-05 TaxID=3446115 RepID=UPI003F52D0E2
MAAAVVSGEVAVCVLMVVPGPVSHGIGFVLAGTLLLAFSAAILTVVRRRVTATCRCFGPSTVPLGERHVARNVVLALSAGLGCAATFQGGPMEVGALVVAAFTGLVLGVAEPRAQAVRGSALPGPAPPRAAGRRQHVESGGRRRAGGRQGDPDDRGFRRHPVVPGPARHRAVPVLHAQG